MSPPARPPRQRLGVDARRAAILDAAREAYADAAYADISVARVAEAAGASPALVFHYFGSKAGLYEEVVRASLADLAQRQSAAAAAVPPGSPARDHVRAVVLVYLDHVASHPRAWATPLTDGQEPAVALRRRREARIGYVEMLRDLLALADWPRHTYALWGFFGFLDQACLAWVERGCPTEDRHPIVEGALGALEGALGDWGR